MNWKLTIGLAALAASVACSSGSKGISVSAKTAAADAAAPGSVENSLDLGNGITLERVRLVVRKVEVEQEDSDGGCTVPPPPVAGAVSPLHDDGDDGDDDGPGDHDGSGEDDSCELEFGPFLVDLSGDELAQGIHWMFDVPVPAGTYDELEIKINTINANKAGDDPGLQEMAEKHASIWIEGVVDDGSEAGAPFEFAVPFEVEQEREGDIVVDPDTGAGVTLDIDPSGWFTGPGGEVLDPNDPTNQGQIRHNIRDSIRLEHDDDGDGCDDDVDPACDDDGGDHGGDDGGGGGNSGPG